MSKAQTDIRTTSYDALAARPHGYQGTLDDALAQLRAEPDAQAQSVTARAELLMFLNVRPGPSDGPSLEDDHVAYGKPAEAGPSKFSVAYAESRGWLPPAPGALSQVRRFARLDRRQFDVFMAARKHHSTAKALLMAEYYPYPYPRNAG